MGDQESYKVTKGNDAQQEPHRLLQEDPSTTLSCRAPACALFALSHLRRYRGNKLGSGDE
jgi:hypothetical protein